MTRFWIAAAALSVVLALAATTPTALRAEDVSCEEAAARLSAATVTVRILPGKNDGTEKPAEPADAQPGDSVTVASGVSVGPNLVATFFSPERHAEQPANRFRVTLPDGRRPGPCCGWSTIIRA